MSDGAAGGPPGARRVPTGPRRARGDAGGFRMGPYMSCAPIRISRAIRRAPSGAVVPKQGSDGKPVGTLIWHDGPRQGSMDRRTDPYRCTTHVRTHTGPSGVPTGPPGPHRDPTDPRRTPGGTVGPRFIGASPVWAARSSYWRQPLLWYWCRRNGSPLQSKPRRRME